MTDFFKQSIRINAIRENIGVCMHVNGLSLVCALHSTIHLYVSSQMVSLGYDCGSKAIKINEWWVSWLQ